MATWLYEVDFRKFLTKDDSQEAMEKADKEIEESFSELPEDLKKELLYLCKELQTAAANDSPRWFNLTLNAIYDYMDKERIWLKF